MFESIQELISPLSSLEEEELVWQRGKLFWHIWGRKLVMKSLVHLSIKLAQEEGLEWRRERRMKEPGRTFVWLFSLLISSFLTAGKASPPEPKPRLLLLVAEWQSEGKFRVVLTTQFLILLEKALYVYAIKNDLLNPGRQALGPISWNVKFQ